MSKYIENTNYISNDDVEKESFVSLLQINRSPELDDLAGKLNDNVLLENADAYLPNEGKHKAKMSDLVNVVGLLFTLFRKVGDNPVFLVMRKWDWRDVSGFYFFGGTYEEVKQKLTKLSEVSQNLYENPRWH